MIGPYLVVAALAFVAVFLLALTLPGQTQHPSRPLCPTCGQPWPPTAHGPRRYH